jgi:O-antigen/teichoic acid export membrane protein
VVVPFSKLRAENRPTAYAIVKIGNVAFNLLLNIFFLVYLPKWASSYSSFQIIYVENYQVGYIFLANLLASLATFLVLSPVYLKGKWHFNKNLWIKMTGYALPILFSGIAFAINEHLDKILLEKLLPSSIAKSEVGAYSACYKLALFMTLYATAFRLGIEPFFFSHAKNKNAPQTYAKITKYFVVIGCVILLGVVVFADILKIALLRDRSYWEAMKAVPLILLANFFLGIYTNLSIWYKLTDRTNMGAWISFIGAAITLLLNFSLIPLFEKTGKDGYMGSAIATVAAYATMMIISYVLGKKHYPIPYETGKVMLYLFTAVVFSGAAFYVFREQYFVTLPLFGFFLAIVYYNEKADFDKILKSNLSK